MNYLLVALFDAVEEPLQLAAPFIVDSPLPDTGVQAPGELVTRVQVDNLLHRNNTNRSFRLWPRFTTTGSVSLVLISNYQATNHS